MSETNKTCEYSCETCEAAENCRNRPRVPFTKEMRKTHTILMPNMLPRHLKMIGKILEMHGYTAKVMEYGLHGDGRKVIDAGLLNVHNDICYPAQLIIGQMLVALESGDYDPHKVAFLYPQTGGGCRASNYIHLARKALAKAGYGYVPVISLNVAGLEPNPGFKLKVKMLHQAAYALFYGDLLMCLVNQTKPYEIEKGSAETLADRWMDTLIAEMSKKRLRYGNVKRNYLRIIEDFKKLPIRMPEQRIRVGIVGEIFVKFSPLGNNELEKYLISEGAEPVMAGLVDFILFCAANYKYDRSYYGFSRTKALLGKIVYDFLLNRERDMARMIRENSSFIPPCDFQHTESLTEGVISHAVKMGEGWLLTAEMLELVDSGVENVVITQPFGCLPNHIVGKGMMKPVKDRFPQVNLVAIDYDSGATKINQENRLKLMLANARERMQAAGSKGH